MPHEVKKADAKDYIAAAHGQTAATLKDIDATDFEVGKIATIINGAKYLRVYYALHNAKNTVVLIGVDPAGREMLSEEANGDLKNAAEYGIVHNIQTPLP